MVAGVDGCKNGWVVAIDLGNGHTKVQHVETFSTLLLDQNLSVIVIDIPIGLLSQGARECDLEARKLLGRKRRSSVFPAPLRPMLAASDWNEACRIRFEVERKKCSKQAAAIIPKILEVDQSMTVELQHRVLEGHPEVSFTLMKGGSSMLHRKMTREGKEERLHLLAKHFPDIREQIASCGLRGVVTDVIDAYACLWTARRVNQGIARTLPDIPQEQKDCRGLKSEILI